MSDMIILEPNSPTHYQHALAQLVRDRAALLGVTPEEMAAAIHDSIQSKIFEAGRG